MALRTSGGSIFGRSNQTMTHPTRELQNPMLEQNFAVNYSEKQNKRYSSMPKINTEITYDSIDNELENEHN